MLQIFEPQVVSNLFVNIGISICKNILASLQKLFSAIITYFEVEVEKLTKCSEVFYDKGLRGFISVFFYFQEVS